MADSQVSIPVKSFDMNVGSYQYTFTRLDVNTMVIRCEHIHEFYVWKDMFENSSINKILTTKSPKIGQDLRIKHIWEILYNQSKNIMNEYIKISIPDKSVSVHNPLCIEITLYATYDKELFTVYIIPIKSVWNYEYTVNRKLLRDKEIKKKQKEKQINEIQKNLTSLNNTVETLTERLELVINAINHIPWDENSNVLHVRNLPKIKPIDKFNDCA